MLDLQRTSFYLLYCTSSSLFFHRSNKLTMASFLGNKYRGVTRTRGHLRFVRFALWVVISRVGNASSRSGFCFSFSGNGWGWILLNYGSFGITWEIVWRLPRDETVRQWSQGSASSVLISETRHHQQIRLYFMAVRRRFKGYILSGLELNFGQVIYHITTVFLVPDWWLVPCVSCALLALNRAIA